jgi:hypothetical protein
VDLLQNEDGISSQSPVMSEYRFVALANIYRYKPKAEAPVEVEKPIFAPRQHVKKEGKYMDRAERRRQGMDDEYKPVCLALILPAGCS